MKVSMVYLCSVRNPKDGFVHCVYNLKIFVHMKYWIFWGKMYEPSRAVRSCAMFTPAYRYLKNLITILLSRLSPTIKSLRVINSHDIII